MNDEIKKQALEFAFKWIAEHIASEVLARLRLAMSRVRSWTREKWATYRRRALLAKLCSQFFRGESSYREIRYRRCHGGSKATN